MEVKQLVRGNPKEGFLPITQDTIVVVELNEAILSLTNSSTSEEIIDAFDNDNKFITLIDNIRVKENIMNGILINNATQGGNVNASIIADKSSERLDISFIYNNTYSAITVTRTNGNYVCSRQDKNLFA